MATRKSKVKMAFKSGALHKVLFYQIFKCKNKEHRDLNYRLNYKNPRSFNEWTIWMKYNYRNELWYKCADKLGLKDFLKENNLGQYAIKTLKVYNSSSEINLDELPEEFVLKTNNDSGSVFICNKKTSDFKTIFEKLDKSVSRNFANSYGEWAYGKITPKIFAEEKLVDALNNELVDYKLYGFNGFYGFGFIAQNRAIDTRIGVFENDLEFQDVDYIYLRPRKEDLPKKPEKFGEMVEICKKLSSILKFARVDFFNTTQGLKIGEITFFSQAGHGLFSDKKYDFKYGKYFSEYVFNKDNAHKTE